MRIELTPSAWKAEVLPLNYIRRFAMAFHPASFFLERKTRFELATLALARRCSTPEPLPHNCYIGRGWWIRTTESSANGFTVRPLWPLGKPSKHLVHFFNIGAGGGNRTPPISRPRTEWPTLSPHPDVRLLPRKDSNLRPLEPHSD